MRDMKEIVKDSRITEILETAEDGITCLVFTPHLTMLVNASFGDGWDHVSVSPYAVPRCPMWLEMEAVKQVFFRPDETVMQLYPPTAGYESHHPYVLHMWRPQDGTIPQPPAYMV